MELVKLKIRCFVCWKSFMVPSLSNLGSGTHIFINYKSWEFRFLNSKKNTEVDRIIMKKLLSNKRLLQDN